MYNETYDDYIRSVLGYPPNNIYNDYPNYTRDDVNYSMMSDEDLESCYPEIYKVVYPMVVKRCNSVRSTFFTNDEIESMTDEIYNAFEERNVAPLNNNQNGEARTAEKEETRQFNMRLRDLIKILLIRELLHRRRRPIRPRPPMPPRPRPY